MRRNVPVRGASPVPPLGGPSLRPDQKPPALTSPSIPNAVNLSTNDPPRQLVRPPQDNTLLGASFPVGSLGERFEIYRHLARYTFRHLAPPARPADIPRNCASGGLMGTRKKNHRHRWKSSAFRQILHTKIRIFASVADRDMHPAKKESARHPASLRAANDRDVE